MGIFASTSPVMQWVHRAAWRPVFLLAPLSRSWDPMSLHWGIIQPSRPRIFMNTYYVLALVF